jgi:serpin B
MTADQVSAPLRRAVPPADTSLAVRSIDALGTELYRRMLPTAAGGNLLLSPLSIGMALAMVRTGAAGATREQIDTVLRAGPGDALDQSLNALDRALADRSGPKGSEVRAATVELAVASSLWCQRDLALEPAFLAALATDYGAGAFVVDFGADAEGARTTINRWVSDRTADRIPDLLPPGAVTAMTRLVLTDALYLKAPWATPFTAAGDAPFTRLDGTVREVATMSGSQLGRYGTGTGWQAASVAYLGHELSMLVIVPDDLAEFEERLDGPALAAVARATTGPLGSLRLPRFSFRSRTRLGDQLAEAGMPLAFDPTAADFSGITADEQLCIDDVHHQTFVAVDEQGTEAAAATAVVMRRMAAVDTTLVVDRPFLFAIRDDATGATLFLGRVTDPAAV